MMTNMTAYLTLDNGFQIKLENLKFYKGVKTIFRDELEKEIVKRWNESQPHMIHKAVKCHLMRN